LQDIYQTRQSDTLLALALPSSVNHSLVFSGFSPRDDGIADQSRDRLFQRERHRNPRRSARLCPRHCRELGTDSTVSRLRDFETSRLRVPIVPPHSTRVSPESRDWSSADLCHTAHARGCVHPRGRCDQHEGGLISFASQNLRFLDVSGCRSMPAARHLRFQHATTRIRK